ncbi:hypothetical protein [Pseudomonas sp. SID14000]|uniref:hypothetical protein n=1 Tax=Pseudomonas sp. SID14000 TaxID=1986221 RepID=UPI0014838FC2|nr:hypothetical protein [Pseudomonas sp. SID14000]
MDSMDHQSYGLSVFLDFGPFHDLSQCLPGAWPGTKADWALSLVSQADGKLNI